MSLVNENESYEEFHKRLMDSNEVHPFEVFSFNYTMACFMLPRVKKLKKQFENYPRSFLESYKKNPTEENLSYYVRYRDFIYGLNDMIFLFNFYAKGREFEVVKTGVKHQKRIKKTIKNGWKALRKNYNQMWF